MRMRKITEMKERPTLEAAAKDFIGIKQAQMLSEETLHDYKVQLDRFLSKSRNSTEYAILEQDTLAFFASIPDTSPARYNKPYQYISAFFGWMVKQSYIPKNPITANDLKKRRDEGNIKPVSVDDLQRFMASLDKKTYPHNLCSDRNNIRMITELSAFCLIHIGNIGGISSPYFISSYTNANAGSAKQQSPVVYSCSNRFRHLYRSIRINWIVASEVVTFMSQLCYKCDHFILHRFAIWVASYRYSHRQNPRKSYFYSFVVYTSIV